MDKTRRTSKRRPHRSFTPEFKAEANIFDDGDTTDIGAYPNLRRNRGHPLARAVWPSCNCHEDRSPDNQKALPRVIPELASASSEIFVPPLLPLAHCEPCAPTRGWHLCHAVENRPPAWSGSRSTSRFSISEQAFLGFQTAEAARALPATSFPLDICYTAVEPPGDCRSVMAARKFFTSCTRICRHRCQARSTLFTQAASHPRSWQPMRATS